MSGLGSRLEGLVRDGITKCLYDGQSPENIAGRITTKEKHLPSIGKDAIYTFIASIYGRRIEYARNKKKVKSKGRGTKVTKLKDRTFIDKRPKSINERKRCGDTEADFIVSGKTGKSILLTVADRKIRVSFVIPKQDCTPNEVKLHPLHKSYH